MTRYEVGFMNKCAEYGLDAETSVQLMKQADFMSAFNSLKGKALPMLQNYWSNLTGARASSARALADKTKSLYTKYQGKGLAGKGKSLGIVRSLKDKATRYGADALAAEKARDAARLGTGLAAGGLLTAGGLGYAAGRGGDSSYT